MAEQRFILPTRIETERLHLRTYRAGGAMYFGVSVTIRTDATNLRCQRVAERRRFTREG